MPATEQDAELLTKIKTGEIVSLTYKRMRNYRFHKKWWALMAFAFDYWEPTGSFNKWGVVPERNLYQFRKDVTVMAGFYNASYRLDGDVTLEAKSIAFGNMSEDEFEKLYSACVDVILKHICTQLDGAKLDAVIDQTMAYA